MIELGNIPEANLDEVVNILLQYKAEGKQASCRFGDHTFYSDTITMDDAYVAVTGDKRDDYFRKQAEGARQMKLARRKALETYEEREARYQRLIEATRVPGEEIEIEEETVVEGLKFILENPSISQEKLILGLLMLDCNFTFDDYHRQFDGTPRSKYVEDGLREGELSAAVTLILNARDSEYGREKVQSRKGLAYQYIRKVTGDDSYGSGDEQFTGGGKIM